MSLEKTVWSLKSPQMLCPFGCKVILNCPPSAHSSEGQSITMGDWSNKSMLQPLGKTSSNKARINGAQPLPLQIRLSSCATFFTLCSFWINKRCSQMVKCYFCRSLPRGEWIIREIRRRNPSREESCKQGNVLVFQTPSRSFNMGHQLPEWDTGYGRHLTVRQKEKNYVICRQVKSEGESWKVR